MQMRKLTDRVSVSPQITPADIGAIRDAGFGTIICNRPDGEKDDQPPSAAITEAAAAAGLDFVVNPVVPGQATDANIDAQAAALAASESPVFAYCASGNRSTILWALANVDGLGEGEILKRAEAAGYDPQTIATHLHARKDRQETP